MEVRCSAAAVFRPDVWWFDANWPAARINTERYESCAKWLSVLALYSV